MKNTLYLFGLVLLAVIVYLMYQNQKDQKTQISLLFEQNEMLRTQRLLLASPLINMSKPRTPVGFKLPGNLIAL